MDVLHLLAHSSGGRKDDPVVSLKKWQNSWDSALQEAKIKDLRWHDLRATFITRMAQSGLSEVVVAKVSGHSDHTTLYKHYLRTDKTSIDAVRAALDNRR